MAGAWNKAIVIITKLEDKLAKAADFLNLLLVTRTLENFMWTDVISTARLIPLLVGELECDQSLHAKAECFNRLKKCCRSNKQKDLLSEILFVLYHPVYIYYFITHPYLGLF